MTTRRKRDGLTRFRMPRRRDHGQAVTVREHDAVMNALVQAFTSARLTAVPQTAAEGLDAGPEYEGPEPT